MPFKNVPVKNPGRYFEQFVKVVQPKGSADTGGNNLPIMGKSPPGSCGWKQAVSEPNKKQGGGQTWS